MKIENIKEYYSKKSLEDYRVDYLYHNVTEVMNQVLRIKLIKNYFGKYLKSSGNKVLDLACGNANDIINLNKIFSKKIIKFVGVDLGKKTIKQLNYLNIKNCKFVNGDVENIDLKEKFDIVLSSEVAEHLEDFDAHLRVIKNHLKPDGHLILSTPNGKYLFRDIYRIISIIFKPKSVKEIEHQHDHEEDEHINVMPYCYLKNKLNKYGFEILEKKRTMLMFGAGYAEPYYGVLAFIDNILPKNWIYLGNGVVLVARIKHK